MFFLVFTTNLDDKIMKINDVENKLNPGTVCSVHITCNVGKSDRV